MCPTGPHPTDSMTPDMGAAGGVPAWLVVSRPQPNQCRSSLVYLKGVDCNLNILITLSLNT